MNRTALNDDRLSWKAKGIIAYMLSMPDDWTFYVEELIKHSKDGESSFRSGLKELKDLGYIKRFPVRNETKIQSWETIVFEVPQVEKQDVENLLVENQHVENQDVENQGLLSTDVSLSTEPKLNTDVIKDIVEYLNKKADKSFKYSSNKTKDLIKARWNEGYSVDDFKKVIDIKCAEWLNDSKMNKFIRPETLFSPKFEGYLNQKGGNPFAKSRTSLEGYNFDKKPEFFF